MGSLRIVALLASLLVLLPPSLARAYTLGSGMTTSCHEVITFDSIVELLPGIDTSQVVLPKDDTWKKIGRTIAEAIRDQGNSDISVSSLTDEELFVLFSVVVGVRSPDTEGHSVSNMNTLRRIHGDPDPDGQYVHALRGPGDDGLEGDVAAVNGTKRIIRALFDRIREAGQKAPADRVIAAKFYLDFYDQVDVKVMEGPYLFGRVIHAIQDSYSHMLRNDDGSNVLHVMNYEEAIAGELEESRDGMAHSNSLDDCTGPIDVLTDAARDASSGAALAALAFAQGDETLLEQGLSPCPDNPPDPRLCGWITYNPQCEAALMTGESTDPLCCTQENDYCDSTWLHIARESQSGPYLEAIFGCTASSRGSTPFGPFVLSAALGAAWLARRRARKMAALLAFVAVALTAKGASAAELAADRPEEVENVGATALPEEAHPAFVGLEGHLSLFSDAPETSIISATMGYALRGGYRWGQWGLLGHIERNYWLPTELTASVEPGALNIGVGGEHIFAKGFLRSSAVIGPSILMFDTELHESGEVGFFFELRPLGVRYHPWEHLVIAFDPLSVALVQPIVGSGPTIRQMEYRTLLGAEFLF